MRRKGLVFGSVAAVVLLCAEVAVAGSPFVPAGTLAHPRVRESKTLLPDGHVLFAGGDTSCSPPGTAVAEAELWDPKSMAFSAAGTMPATLSADGGLTAAARCLHAAAALGDGRVVLLGGMYCSTGYTTTVTTIFTPPASWAAAASMPRIRFMGHTATTLADSRVLVVGGIASMSTTELGIDTVDVFDPATSSWSTTAKLPEGRVQHGAVRLPDGRVMIVGGLSGWDMSAAPLATTFIFDPKTSTWASGPPMPEPRAEAFVFSAGGKVAVVAGRGGSKPGGARAVLVFDTSTSTWSSIDAGVGLASGAAIGGSEIVVIDSPMMGKPSARVVDLAKGTIRMTGTIPDGADSLTLTSSADGALIAQGCGDGKASPSAVYRFVQSAAGAPCTAPETCVSGICAKGTCATACSADAECIDGMFCKGGTCASAQALGTNCATPRQCVSGSCLDGYCCRDTTSCAPYTCAATGCRTSCASSTECAKGFACNAGACVPDVAKATCAPDLGSSIAPDGTPKNCTPYRCDTSSGECQTACGSSSDCVGGFVCKTDTKECVGAVAGGAPSDGGGGGCTLGPTRSNGAILALLALLGLMARVRRATSRGPA
ncbi:MAG: Kelch repeat-containing protein [Polyangiales bacterium]